MGFVIRRDRPDRSGANRRSPRAAAVTAAVLGALGACAGADPVSVPAAAPAAWRAVMVKLASPTADTLQDPDDIARKAAAVAGVPVRYAAPVSAQWHALQLSCGAPADCDAALQRLRAATATFAAVERDERRRPN